MIEDVKKLVYDANLMLPELDLIKMTWGNVSGFAEGAAVFVIKPSGLSYDVMTPQDMVVVDLEDQVVEGKLRPSSDTPTHTQIYKYAAEKGLYIAAVVHTHSPWATSWAQAGKDIPAFGTTHADTFYGDIPCARYLTKAEVTEDYEKNTGKLIVETFEERGLDMEAIPGIVLHGHGVFTWGSSPKKAVENSLVLEECAKMALLTQQINPNAEHLPLEILDKHYLRKHGENAYYGQK